MGLEFQWKMIINGRRANDFCVERGLSVSSTYFEHKSLHKFTMVARGQDKVEVKRMIGAGEERRLCGQHIF